MSRGRRLCRSRFDNARRARWRGTALHLARSPGLGRFGRPAAWMWLLGATAVFAAGPASAHALIQRYDLPLPLWHYLVGAGSAVLLSFVLVAVAAREATPAAPPQWDIEDTPVGRVLRTDALQRIAAVVSALSFASLLAAGLFGRQDDPFANILPLSVWVIWWVGFVFVAALLGDAWPAINPIAAIARCVRSRAVRTPAPERAAPSRWLAVALFLVFAWAELVWPNNARPASLAAAIILYAALSWAGMARYGIEPWLRRADPFALTFALFGRFGLLGCDRNVRSDRSVRSDRRGRLTLRPFGAGLITPAAAPTAMVVFVLVLLSTVAYDGFLHTPPWRILMGYALDLSYDVGLIGLLGNVGARSVVMTVGLLTAPLVFVTVFLGVCRVVAVLAGGHWTALAVARRFVLTLLPIAIAYHLAHYLSLLMVEGQRILFLASDPFGLGWNLFGTAGREPDIGIIGAEALWGFAVVAIVAGHAIAVWLGHHTARAAFGERRVAVVAELPLLALMVCYTMISLWILAQPIVAV